jgi:hypothetical protein
MRTASPKLYEYSHWLSLRLHDHIAHTLAVSERARIFDVEFHVDDGDQADALAEIEDGEEIWSWLEHNGHEDVVSEVARRQVMAALMADLCHFSFEALSCSKKGKLTVAFALLRKPFKDNLLYLEWMLADPGDFASTFRDGGSAELDKIATQREGPARRVELLSQAIGMTMNLTGLTAEAMLDIRYNKDYEDGFAGLYDKAIHLITTHKPIRTEECNFNFVFSGDAERLSQWHLLYTTLPLLLNHAVEVVNALMDRIANRNPGDFETMQLERAVGMRIWFDGLTQGFERTKGLDLLKLVRKLSMKCPRCRQRATVAKNDEDLRTIYRSGQFRCVDVGTRGFSSDCW